MNCKSVFTDVYASAVSVFISSSEVQFLFWDYSAFVISPVVGMAGVALWVAYGLGQDLPPQSSDWRCQAGVRHS